MSDNKLVDSGIEAIKIAVQADRNSEFNKALTNYILGTEYLLTGSKYVKNPRVKESIVHQANSYLERAEYLKKHLNNPPRKKVAREGGGNSDEDDKDDEKSKFEKALSGAIVVETPNVKWSDVAGLEKAKEMLKEAVILPIKFPHLFTGKRVPWKGILLYGPPGTGKSYLAKAVATEANNSTFFAVSSSDLVSKFLGESEKLVRTLFESARKKAPSIIFIDEIDSLCGNRSDGDNDSSRRIKTEFLVQMQGVGKDNAQVLVLGATNTPWQLDPAIRRRFQKRIHIPLPDDEARKIMLRLHVGNTPNKLTPADYDYVAAKTEGFSGSDLDSLVRDALYEPIRLMLKARTFKRHEEGGGEYYVPCSVKEEGAVEMNILELPPDKVKPLDVELRDFMRVLPGCSSSVSKADLKKYTKWTGDFGQEG